MLFLAIAIVGVLVTSAFGFNKEEKKWRKILRVISVIVTILLICGGAYKSWQADKDHKDEIAEIKRLHQVESAQAERLHHDGQG